MCHICRKVEGLSRLNSKATKPISMLLSELHSNIVPHLGDIWLWRYKKTVSLRAQVEKLHKYVPLSALQAILDDVDRHLQHIQNSMPDHIPRISTGRWDKLKLPVTPSESGSVQWENTSSLQNRKGKLSDELGKDIEEVNKRAPKQVVVERSSEAQSLRGSDGCPCDARIQQSIRVVDAWLEKCDDIAMTVASTRRGNETISSTPSLFHSLTERPAQGKRRIWRRLRLRSPRKSSGTYSDAKSERHPHSKASSVHAIDRTSSAPLETQHIESDLKLSETLTISTETETTRSTQNSELSFEDENVGKAKKMNNRRGIPVLVAAQIFEISGRAHSLEQSTQIDRRYDEVAGQSLTSLEAVVGISRLRMTSKDISRSVSVETFDRQKSRETRMSESSINQESDKSVLSSGCSPPNAGSLIPQYLSLVKQNPINAMKFSPQLPGGTEGTRSQSLNQTPSTVENMRDRWWHQQDLSGGLKIEVDILRDDYRFEEQPSRKKVIGGFDGRDSGVEECSAVSEAIKRSRRRRAERALNSIPVHDRYRYEERGKVWLPKKM